MKAHIAVAVALALAILIGTASPATASSPIDPTEPFIERIQHALGRGYVVPSVDVRELLARIGIEPRALKPLPEASGESP